MLKWVEPKRDVQDYIEAIMADGSHHFLPPRVLDVMLYNNRVKQFKRSSGWVTVGVHPTRAKHKTNPGYIYSGTERRTSVNYCHS
jgi:hypothetical protein